MATLFEINADLDALLPQLVDEETGEINEEVYQKVQDLEISREDKIDSWCFYMKQRKAEIDAAKQLLTTAQNRLRAMEDGLLRTKERFTELMDGEKFKSAYNTVYYTHTESVVPDQDFDYTKVDDDFLVYRLPDLNKAKIKAAIKLGIEVPGVHLEEKTTLVVR